MILCLDVGNTQIFGGVFSNNTLRFQFRFNSETTFSSDQFGIFLRNVLRENDIDPKAISKIAVCSVVPHVDYSLRSACNKYFSCEPFMLQAGVKTGLKIKYRNPQDVGADRIANAIAATQLYPNKNIIIVDFGTATTFCVINANKEYLGGAIMPGMRLSMHALQSNTAKLSSVKIIKPEDCLGTSTATSIQSGLYYSQFHTIKHLCRDITEQHLNSPPVILGTGGFSHLFAEENIFDAVIPDLVLQGLYQVLALND